MGGVCRGITVIHGRCGCEGTETDSVSLRADAKELARPNGVVMLRDVSPGPVLFSP